MALDHSRSSFKLMVTAEYHNKFIDLNLHYYLLLWFNHILVMIAFTCAAGQAFEAR